MKQSKNHNIYEVWNEWASESIFVDHKPTQKELQELIEIEGWRPKFVNCTTVDDFLKEYIHVEKLQHFYTSGE
jgi:sporulation-control protein spo0M